ncbi:MAG: ribosomal-protein-alanine N-acetyltransferase, partial [Bilophila wadsworthia]
LQGVLEVRISNAPAIHLYESFGFRQAGKRRGYYQDTGEDALIYTLDMGQTRTNP